MLSKEFLQKKLEKLDNPSWAIIILLVGIYFFTKELYGTSDFTIFYLAAEKYRLGEDPYTQLYVNGFNYFYSPLFALLLSPFTYIKLDYVGWAWKLFNLLLVYKTLGLIQSLFNISKTTALFNVLFFLSTIFLIYFNLHNHQMTILLIWGIFYSLKLFKAGKLIFPSFMLALIINFKIMPIVLIPYLIYRKQFKPVLIILVFFVSFLFIPSIFSGWTNNLTHHANWWALINPINKEHNLDVSEKGLCSISTLIPVYFMDSAKFDDNFEFKRNIMVLDESTVIFIINFLRLVFISSFLLVLNTLPFKKITDDKKIFFEISYLLYITFLIFPHQQLYAMYLAVPMIFYCLYQFFQLDFTYKKAWITFFVIALLFINSSFIIGNFRFLYDYIKLHTFGILFLIPIFIKLKMIENKA